MVPTYISNSRTPTEEELNRCHHIELTLLNEWNPDSIVLGEIYPAPKTLTIEMHI